MKHSIFVTLATGLFLLANLFMNNSAFAASDLNGQLLAEGNQPLANTQLHIRSINQKTTTDEQGNFTFTQLEDGRYVLDIEAGSDGHINYSLIHDGSAQTIKIDLEDSETIVVTGNPLEHSSLEMASPALIVSGEELIKNRGANIGETLAEVPGINLSSFGAGAGRPVIRGQQGNRVKVLANNSATQDASNASPDHWIAAEPLLAKRIEVLKGPATLLYGGGAVGGAVNVVDNKIPTTMPDPNGDGIEGGLELRLADSATGEQSAVGTITSGHGPIALHLEAFKSSTDDIEIPSFAESKLLHESEEEAGEAEHEEEAFGLLENSNTETQGVSAGFSYISDKGFWGASFSRYDREYGVPGHAEHHEEEEEGHEGEHEEHEEAIRLDVKQQRLDVKGQWNEPFANFQSLKLSFAKTDYEHQELEISPEETHVGTTFSNDSDETRIELVHKTIAGWQGAFGLQFSNSEFSAIGEESFIPASDTRNLGLFWLEEINSDNWHTEFGARFDQRKLKTAQFGEHKNHAYSFAAGTLWHINQAWSLPINLSYAERLPTVEELFSNAGNNPTNYVPHLATLTVEVGDQNLKAEAANNIDIGIRYHTDDVHSSIALFYNKIDDFIFLQDRNSATELPILDYTQQDATFKGLEAEVEWAFADTGASYWEAGLFGDLTIAELSDGSYVPRTPAKRIGASLSYQHNDYSAELKAIRTFAQTHVAQNELATAANTLVNFNFGYNFYFADSELFAFFKINNLLDEEIRDHASFIKDIAPRAGRSLSAGLRLTF